MGLGSELMELDSPGEGRTRFGPRGLARMAAVWGPGLLVMLADTDAGNVVTAAQAGAQWGFRLAPLLLLLIPGLFLLQDLSLRLGLSRRAGLGRLIRERCGRAGAWLAAAALVAATLSSLVTELSGIAGVGEMFGVSRTLTVSGAAILLMGVVLTGAYQRTERIALLLGLFEASFFIVAWKTHPSWVEAARDAVDLPLANPRFLYLGAALIGATFNPWMVFYQSTAVVEKKLGPGDYHAARADTLVGAVLTQAITASILIALAALKGGAGGSIDDIGQISGALTPLLGDFTGRLVFGLGVVGAAMAAAIVATLACAWGLGELICAPSTSSTASFRRPGFLALYSVAVVGSAALVLGFRDLVGLSIAMQALNAVLLPGIGALALYVGATALRSPFAIGPVRIAVIGAILGAVSLAGLTGAAAGFF